MFTGFHWSDGVRAGRTNTDFEDIEYANHDASIAISQEGGVRRPKAAQEVLAEQRVEMANWQSDLNPANAFADVAAVLRIAGTF